MAINISLQPAELTRSGNPMTYTFNSDQTNQDNFAFIVEVYKNGVIQSNHRVYPESGANGRIDISQIAEYELSKPLIPSALYVDASNYSDFHIVVKEFYGAVPVVGLSATSLVTTTWKAKTSDFYNFYYPDFFPTPSGGLLLTEFTETTLYPNELFFLYGLNMPSDPFVTLRYYEADGTIRYSNDTGVNQYDCTGVKLDYLFLNSNYAGGAAWESIAYIEVVITNGLNYFNTYVINVKHISTCITPTRLHWLSKIGGIDSFSFTRPTREEQKTRAESYAISSGQWFGSNYGASESNLENATFQTTSETHITLESGFVNEDTQRLIYENLMTSPYVLVEWKDRLLRVGRSGMTVKFKHNKLDQLFNVMIKINIENFKSMIV